MTLQEDSTWMFLAFLGSVILFFFMIYIYKSLIVWWFEIKHFRENSIEIKESLKEISETLKDIKKQNEK